MLGWLEWSKVDDLTLANKPLNVCMHAHIRKYDSIPSKKKKKKYESMA